MSTIPWRERLPEADRKAVARVWHTIAQVEDDRYMVVKRVIATATERRDAAIRNGDEKERERWRNALGVIESDLPAAVNHATIILSWLRATPEQVAERSAVLPGQRARLKALGYEGEEPADRRHAHLIEQRLLAERAEREGRS